MQHRTAHRSMRTFNFTLLAAVLSYVAVIGAAPRGNSGCAPADCTKEANDRRELELYVV
jgi:hypothetical protein